MLRKWFWNILIAIDQLGNAIFAGDPQETISSRAGKARNEDKPWGNVLCPVLDWIDPNHCATSIDSSEGDDAVF